MGGVHTPFSSHLTDQARGRRVSSAQEANETIDQQSYTPSFGQAPALSDKEIPRSLLNTQVSHLSEPAEAEISPNRPSFPTRRRSYRRHRDSDLHSSNAPSLPLETPPSSGSFEWDERTGKASGDRFVDGMASLTSRSMKGAIWVLIPGIWKITYY